MRDESAGGLARLLARADWRDSGFGPAMRSAVTGLVADENPLVRMRAATGFRALHTELDPAERVAAPRDRIVAEADERVLSVLISELSRDATSAPEEVDAVLAELFDRPTGAFLATYAARRGENGVPPLLAYLAAVAQTAFASGLLAGWFCDPIVHHETVTRLVHSLGTHLNTPDGRGQQAAFELLMSAAVAARDRWQRLPASQSGETPPDVVTELRAAATVVDDIAERIYRASGATDDETGDTKESARRGDAFAELAIPVLETCAEVPSPPCIHAVVRTLAHLAPLDEKRTLLAVAAAVPERSRYAADRAAGDVVVRYLHRLLTGNRSLVLYDPDGLTAFRHLLQTFAAAGNEEALTLAYSFADVFR
jgi:hypothetical protein